MNNGGFRLGAGRPKGSLGEKGQEAEIFREFLIEKVFKEKSSIISAMIKKAKQGDTATIKELFDRCFGKNRDSIEFKDITTGPFPIPQSLEDAISKAYGEKRNKENPLG